MFDSIVHFAGLIIKDLFFSTTAFRQEKDIIVENKRMMNNHGRFLYSLSSAECKQKGMIFLFTRKLKKKEHKQDEKSYRGNDGIWESKQTQWENGGR